MDEQVTPKMEVKVESDDEDQDEDEDDDNVFLDDDDDDDGGVPRLMEATATSDRQRALYDMVRSMEQSIKDSYNNGESVSDVSDSSYHSPSNIRPLSYTTPCSSSDTVGDIGKEKLDIFQFGGDLFHTEREFIDYLMSLPSSKTESTTTLHQNPGKQLTTLLKPVQRPQATTATGSGNQSPKVGLDHLENLCKLMEQLGELREQNCKLQKRVQYLEEMRCLNEMRKDLKEALEAATALSTPPNNDEEQQPDDDNRNVTRQTSVKMRKSNLKRLEKQRGRSQSMELAQPQPTIKPPAAPTSTILVGRHYDPTVAHKAKVSKWTKVKEALKWERASPMDNANIKGSSCGGGGAKINAHHSSFYVDDDDNQQSPMMVSKASVTLRPPAIVKPQSKCDAASGPILHPTHRKMPSNQKSVVISDVISRRTNRDDVSSGSGDVCDSYFFSRDSFLETSSDEEDDDDEDIHQTRSTSVDKRQSMGAFLTSEEPFGALAARRQSSPIRTRLNVNLKGDQELAVDRKGRSLDRNVDPKMLTKHNESEKESMGMAKTTWGRMKNIIQARKDSLKRKHRKSSSDQPCERSKTESGQNIDDNLEDNTSDITSEFYCEVPGGQTKSKHSSSSSNYGTESNAASSVVLLDVDGRPALKTSPARPHQLNLVKVVPERPCGSMQMMSEYSPTSYRKSKWTKVKKVFLKRDGDVDRRPHSDPASPTNPTAFYYDDMKFIEDYLGDDKDWAPDEPKSEEYATAAVAIQRILAEDKPEAADEQQDIAYSLSTDARRNLEELQRNISHDFCKKLEEWEKLRCGSNKQLQQHQQQQCSSDLSRKGSNKASKVKPEKVCKNRDKELQWLQKQLQKIEREKLRLAKERQKYLEREARLERMKETMMKPLSPSSVKNEVLIKTSAGEFRFEGISQTFTRKLYEWEAMKGIGPEVSTIALLDSQQSYQPQRSQSVKNTTPAPAKCHNTLNSLSPPSARYGRLARSRSRSDSSIADIANVQTSTTSLQIHENVDAADDEGATTGQSRATSEPDLMFTHSDEPPCAVEVEELHYEEFIPCTEIPALRIEEPVYSYTPSEATHLIDTTCTNSSDTATDADVNNIRYPRGERMVVATKTPADDQSANNKEDMCRQLESELKDIDGQMKIMFQKQAEEIREDDEKQLELLGELRNRIEEIEKASEIIKNEKDESEQQIDQSDKRFNKDEISVTTSAPIATTKASEPTRISDKPKMTSKKKEGVVKIQSLSSELLLQAKALEEALVERNATIRKLQWELVQRDMSTTNQQEPEKQTAKTKTKTGNHTHSRSWSSADDAYASRRKITNDKDKTAATNHKPPQLFGSPNNQEVAVLPVELTRKVRELKTELMRLWSSGDSSASEQGSDEKLPCHNTEIAQGGASDCSANKEEQEQQLPPKTSSTNSAEEEVEVETSLKPNRDLDDEPQPGNKEQEPSDNSGCSPKQTASRRDSARSVIARRVSDTSIPTAATNQSELCRQRRRNLSRLPRSPDVNSRAAAAASKIKPDQPVEETVLPLTEPKTMPKIAPPITPTSRLIPRSPLVLVRSHVIAKPSRTNDASDKAATTETINPDCSEAASAVDSKQPIRDEMTKVESPSSSIPIRCPSQNVIKCSSDTSSMAPNSTFAAKKTTTTTTTTNEKITGSGSLHSPLTRQNAEEIGSSSDTDTEGSGVTFTINIGRKHPEKPERRFRVQAPVQKPPRTFIKRDVDTVESSMKTVSSPPLPSTASSSRPSREDSNGNCDVAKVKASNLSNLPTPTRIRRSEIPTTSTSTVITKPTENVAQELQTESPETPIVRSRSTRKLKMPSPTTVPKTIEFTSTPSPTTNEPSPLAFRKGVLRPAKEPAPNVRMMVEKFNMKIVQEQHSPSATRSPLMCLQKRWISSPGVQKSNSFRESQQSPIVGDSVIKSASASTVEGSRFPQSPTFAAQSRASLGQQPVGIASRIPRCLKSILEQDSGEAGKESSEVADGVERAGLVPKGTREVSTASKASNSSSSSSSLSSSATADQYHVVYPMTPPTAIKLPVAYKPTYNRFGGGFAPSNLTMPANRSVTSTPENSRPKVAVTSSSSSEAPTESTATLMKSASAGMVDCAESKPTTSARSSEDLTSSKAPQLQKSGMFNFKFRKAKLKQKKEPLNTVKALCRQSLVVDIQGNSDGLSAREDHSEDQTSRTIPISSKSCPSSPEAQFKQITKSGGWLSKPKILFKSK